MPAKRLERKGARGKKSTRGPSGGGHIHCDELIYSRNEANTTDPRERTSNKRGRIGTVRKEILVQRARMRARRAASTRSQGGQNEKGVLPRTGGPSLKPTGYKKKGRESAEGTWGGNISRDRARSSGGKKKKDAGTRPECGRGNSREYAERKT